MAHISTSALRGFESVAKNGTELGKFVQDFLGLTLAAWADHRVDQADRRNYGS
jgi:hypothetical protein